MDLSNIDIGRLLPDFMQDDPTAKALNAVLEPEIKKLFAETKRLPLYKDLNLLTEAELDALASEVDIPWYNRDFAKSVKIEIIKNSIRMQRKLGTPQTFSEILELIFGGCVLREAGIDYEGLPHHFEVAVADGENLTGLAFERLLAILKKVKRASSWLDNTYSIYNAEGNARHDFVAQQISHDNIKFDLNGHY
jgi:P2-related tail formation protein